MAKRPRRNAGFEKLIEQPKDTVIESKYGPHGKTRNDDCPICAHDHMEAIEVVYCDFQEESHIAAIFQGFTPEELKWHCEALDLHNKRLMNTDSVARVLVEKGIEDLREGRVVVKPELVQRVLAHRDEKEGRMPSRSADNGSDRTLVLVGFPAPGGFLPGAPQTPILATPIEAEYEEVNHGGEKESD